MKYRMAEPLLMPFNPSALPFDKAMNALFAALAPHQVVYPFCAQCFEADYATRMRAHRQIRRAPYEVFRQIYFEHPACSGGLDTFLHWLPRGLELGFVDDELSLHKTLVEQMARVGVLHWPKAHQDALRNVLVSVAVEWFVDGRMLLGVRTYRPQMTPERYVETTPAAISREILVGLVLLMVEPASLFDWLVGVTSARPRVVWEALLEAVTLERLLDDDAYLVLSEGQDETEYRAALRALARLARRAAVTAVSRLDLTQAYEACAETDPSTAALIAEVETELARRMSSDVTDDTDNDRAILSAVLRV